MPRQHRKLKPGERQSRRQIATGLAVAEAVERQIREQATQERPHREEDDRQCKRQGKPSAS